MSPFGALTSTKTALSAELMDAKSDGAPDMGHIKGRRDFYPFREWSNSNKRNLANHRLHISRNSGEIKDGQWGVAKSGHMGISACGRGPS